MWFYLRKKPPKFTEFISSIEGLRGSNIAIVVAFEQPWALDWLLKMAKKNFRKTSILVFDNSRSSAMKSKIKLACIKNKTYYFPLPKYRTYHVNRSHGMALCWIYSNVVKMIQPKIFGFIDHDLIPIKQIDFNKIIRDQPFYGRKTGNKEGFWSLWAGYSLFNFKYLIDKKVNFLYDFSKGLDTGGRNWNPLYENYPKKKLSFASLYSKTIFLPKFKNGMEVQFIDDKWLHIGSISYNNNFDKRFDFFKALSKKLALDSIWLNKK